MAFGAPAFLPNEDRISALLLLGGQKGGIGGERFRHTFVAVYARIEPLQIWIVCDKI